MATFLTIFTIITGIASLLGFAFVFFGAVTTGYNRLCAWSLVVAALWSVYILFVPNTAVEANVAGKIAYYKTPVIERESAVLVLQRGEISFSGFGPRSVEFPLPFLTPPRVEVINTNGYGEDNVPRVKEVTAHQVTFARSSSGGIGMPEGLQVYRWVARGTPLEMQAAAK